MVGVWEGLNLGSIPNFFLCFGMHPKIIDVYPKLIPKGGVVQFCHHFENCCAFASKPFTMNFITLYFSKYCLQQFFALLNLISVQLNLRDQMARAIQTAVLQLLLHHTFSVWLCGLTRFHASDCLSLDPDHSDDNITKVIKAIV